MALVFFSQELRELHFFFSKKDLYNKRVTPQEAPLQKYSFDDLNIFALPTWLNQFSYFISRSHLFYHFVMHANNKT